MELLDGLLLLLAIAVAAPLLVFGLECAAALLPASPGSQKRTRRRPRVAVVVPAHNEAGGIGAMLANLVGQLAEGDRVVVVADNCTDGTAAAARKWGRVEVVERKDPHRRGKGYALAEGVRYLERTGAADVVVMVDADCVVEAGSLDLLAERTMDWGCPVQGTYLLLHSDGGIRSPGAIAFAIRNLVRPAGLARLGLPCLLNGSGMAFPWAIAKAAPFAGGELTEDRWLSLALAREGVYVRFCEEARVVSRMAESVAGERTQRRRWEHGHLTSVIRHAPALLAMVGRQPGLKGIALLADILVPPMALLLSLWAAVLVGSLWAWTRGASGSLPVWVLLASGGVAGASSLLATGRYIGLSWTRLLAVPFYIATKVPMYAAFVFRRQQRWERTERHWEADKREDAR